MWVNDNIVLFNCLSVQDGWSPLMIASFNGHIEVVRVLVKAHADLNKKSKVIIMCVPLKSLPTPVPLAISIPSQLPHSAVNHTFLMYFFIFTFFVIPSCMHGTLTIHYLCNSQNVHVPLTIVHYRTVKQPSIWPDPNTIWIYSNYCYSLEHRYVYFNVYTIMISEVTIPR